MVQDKKQHDIKKFQAQNYYSIIDKSKKELFTLIKEKQNSTATIGISLRNHIDLTKALKNKDGKHIDLKKLSKEFKQNTKFKNVWFHLISKDGISLQRSWSQKKGDQISKNRLDIQKMMKKPQIMNTISVGVFDFTFKSMSPVFDENEKFIGIIEVITHFNSISKQLSADGINAVILADKKYKQQLKHAFTNNFIGQYYVANFDAKAKYLNYLKQTGVEKAIHELKKNPYLIDKTINSIISYSSLEDINGNEMGHFILFNSLNNIEPTKIKNIESIYNLYSFLLLIFLTIIFYLIYTVKRSKQQKKSYINKLLIIMLFIYIILGIFLYKLLETKYHNDIEEYKSNVQKQTLIQYESIISKNQDLAQLVFSSYINQKKVIDLFKNRKREELYNELEILYKDLVKKYNIRQVHFHLPNADSFLRMHKPNKFGDSLIGIRESVEFVNNYQRAFFGFEEGRVFNGFRHVFPVFDENKYHIGSVEISFSIYSFLDNYLELFETKRVNFLIKSSIIDEKVFNDSKNNYIKSPLEGFSFDKIVIKKLNEQSKNIIPFRKNAKDLKLITSNINKGKPFTHYFENIEEIVIIKPLINKISGKILGSIHISKKDSHIKNKLNEFYSVVIILLIVLAFVMIFIYRETLAKQRIQQEFDKNQKILDSQNSFIIITNGDNIKTSNKSMLEFFGFDTLREFKRKYSCICDHFIYEENKNYLQKMMKDKNWFEYIKKHHINKNIKVKMKDKNNNNYIFRVEYKPYMDNNKESIVTFIDITSIEKANLELNKTTKEQKQLLSLFDEGQIVLFKWDLNNNYRANYVSSNVEKIFGYQSKEFLNNTISYFDIINKNDKEDVLKRFKDAIDAKQEFFIHEPYRIINKENKNIHLINNNILVKNNQGQITHILAYIIDISYIKKMESQLIEHEKMASMGSMIGNIAHQWRQPLSTITTASSAMEIESEFGTLSDEKIKDYNNTIIKSAEFLSHTIDTFRNFLKEDKEVKEVVIQERLTTVFEIFEATLNNNYIELKKDINEDNPIVKILPLGELSQVVTNLINNAKDVLIDKDIQEPWIKVECYEKDKTIFVTVEDNGGGINENIIDKIFEPYFTTKHQSQGTGLGLYMSHKIMHENLDGKLYVKNTLNGAKFYIELQKDN